MSHHFRVHEELSRVELDALESFCREPGRTVDEVVERLSASGHQLSRGAVWRWKREFDLSERMSGAGALARVFLDAANSDGGLQIPEAAALQIAQMIFETSARLADEGDVKVSHLTKLSLAMQRLMLAKAHLEDARSEFVGREKTALEAASKQAHEGADGKTVVATIKRALGIEGAP
jgi:hypothetical protein